MSNKIFPPFTCAGAILVTLGDAKREAARNASKTNESWQAFKKELRIDIHKLWRNQASEKHIMGLVDGRILAYWDTDIFSHNADRMHKIYGSRERLDKCAKKSKFSLGEFNIVSLCKEEDTMGKSSCKIRKNNVPFQAVIIDQGTVKFLVDSSAPATPEGDVVKEIAKSLIPAKRTGIMSDSSEGRASKRPMIIRNIADNFVGGITEFSLDEFICMESSEFTNTETRRQILQNVKARIELMSAQNAMSVIQEKENPTVRLAVNILEVFIVHRLLVSFLQSRLSAAQSLNPERKLGSGELDQDALQDRLYWIDQQEQRWAFPECLSTLRSYKDPLRSALRTLRRESKTLATLFETTLKGQGASPQKPGAGNATSEAKDGKSGQNAAQSDEIDILKESLANTISDLREAHDSCTLMQGTLDRTTTELQNAAQSQASLRDEVRVAQAQLEDERRRSSQLEYELQHARQQLKEAEEQLANALSTKAIAKSALVSENSRRLRAEKTLTLLSIELATMQTALNECS